MQATLPALIRALLDPRRYPHPASEVRLIQTHISWVLLAGEFAYKIKKPVRLPFLDFSTLALRRADCEEELRLNRRCAPDLYLEVLPIGNTPDDPRLGAASAAIEYAVRMRRFDPQQQLDQLCQRGELRAAHLTELARTLTRFHASAAVADAGSRFGRPELIRQQASDNLAALRQLLPPAGFGPALDGLQHWTEQRLSQLAPLMRARLDSGRVRECHGDLHLANLVLIDARVQLFDCLEFSEELRWIDVASELAFTYMDLLAHGQAGLANGFIDDCLSLGGDYEAAGLLRFYAVYRALVRAKVAAIGHSQGGQSAAPARHLIELAQNLCRQPAPRLIITHGLSGCGKTALSDQLLRHAPLTPLLRLRSDIERKRLFDLAPTDRSGAQAGIYQADAHERTYARLQHLARQLLQAGWSVIVDATFLRRADRQAFAALARQMHAGFAILAPQATPAQLRQRILDRAASAQDASDATLQVLAEQMQSIEPLDAPERRLLMDVQALQLPPLPSGQEAQP